MFKSQTVIKLLSIFYIINFSFGFAGCTKKCKRRGILNLKPKEEVSIFEETKPHSKRNKVLKKKSTSLQRSISPAYMNEEADYDNS